MNELDDTLTRLFAEARETLPPEDFLESVALRMNHGRRERALKRAALMTVAAGLGIAVTPFIAEGSLTVASHLGVWLLALGNALTSPLGWACSLAVGAWGVRRARRMS
jgi:uncharacterized protein (DUF2062 family)